MSEGVMWLNSQATVMTYVLGAVIVAVVGIVANMLFKGANRVLLLKA